MTEQLMEKKQVPAPADAGPGCCAPAEQSSCCEPSAKAACCGDTKGQECGCK